MRVTSPAFGPNQPIQRKYTADGQNVSPPLRIEDVPPGTRELAVICEDPDAPTPEPFVHWVLYRIPGDVRELPEGVPADRKLKSPAGAEQGPNDMKRIGYTGPEPPPGHGTHHYHFRVYALDKPLEIEPAQDERALLASMAGHVVDSAELVGTYERMK